MRFLYLSFTVIKVDKSNAVKQSCKISPHWQTIIQHISTLTNNHTTYLHTVQQLYNISQHCQTIIQHISTLSNSHTTYLQKASDICGVIRQVMTEDKRLTPWLFNRGWPVMCWTPSPGNSTTLPVFVSKPEGKEKNRFELQREQKLIPLTKNY